MVLFFFGSFNPISIAHLKLAKYSLDLLKYEKVVFIPCPNQYIIDTNREVFQSKIRLELLNLVKENNPWMEISGIEINSNKSIRTYDSLLKLKQTGYNGKLLLGSDNVIQLEKVWKNVDKICKEFGIVCLERNNMDISEYIKKDKYLSTLSNYIEVIKGPKELQNVSSTEIRKLIKEKNYSKLKLLVPDEVYNYFRSKHE